MQSWRFKSLALVDSDLVDFVVEFKSTHHEKMRPDLCPQVGTFSEMAIMTFGTFFMYNIINEIIN